MDVPVVIQNIMKNFSAWTPTFVILIMFKKLFPDTNLRVYFRILFTNKVNSVHIILLFFLQLGILVVAIISYYVIYDLPLKTISLIGASSLIPAFVMCLTSGAIGEELGWRAYALNEFQKKHTPLKSSLLVGLVWGFWHLPLWIFSGYNGLELIFYSVAFIIAIISISVVIHFFIIKEIIF